MSAVLTLMLIGGLIFQSRFVLPQRDFRGAVAQLTELNAQLKPDAIVMMNEPSESTLADNFGVPLQFVFGHDIATIRSQDDSAVPFIDRLLAYATTQQRPVQLLTINPIAPLIREAFQLQPVGEFPITLSALLSTYYDYPSVNQPAYYGFEIYDVIGRKIPSINTSAITVDIGTMDTTFIRSGFYQKESLPNGVTARWTAGEAFVDLPLSSQAAITIEVTAETFRPVGTAESEATVWLDDQEIGRFVPSDTWQTFSFAALPHPRSGVSTLRFVTATFNPSQLHMSTDGRDLGFLIDRITAVTR